MFSATEHAVLLAVIDRIMPADAFPSADGSLHVTNGGYNPVLTILALGLRTGDHIARSL